MNISGCVFLCVILISCGGEPQSSNFDSSASRQAASSWKFDAGSNERDLPIQERLAEATAKANETHNELLRFIDAMFEDGLRQGQSAVCSGSRIWALSNHGSGEHEPEFASFGSRLSRALSSQRFVLLQYDPYYDRAILTIPLADPYGGKTLILDYTHPSFRECAPHYKSPIPNGGEAREIEIRTFAEEIIRARRRLEFYEAKLPVIEANKSRALSFEATLRKMQEDLGFDLLDPTTAVTSMRDYEEFLNRAVDTLDEARREVSVDPLVQDAEIDTLLHIVTE